ncbi:MAG: hypothetical protein KGI54_17370 [Pseudomonadota bacterium]|nr:hypothetical protein [Pseudomonadota bacterium]
MADNIPSDKLQALTSSNYVDVEMIGSPPIIDSTAEEVSEKEAVEETLLAENHEALSAESAENVVQTEETSPPKRKFGRPPKAKA